MELYIPTRLILAENCIAQHMNEFTKFGKKALIVMAEKDENVVKSAANIPGVRTALVGTMNVYEIVNHDSFIVTQEAVKKIEEVYI